MRSELVATGLGVVAATGQGKAAFTEALFNADHAFGVMQRAGRQQQSAFLGAEIHQLGVPQGIEEKSLRAASLTAHAALLVLQEAWSEARLSEIEPRRIGLIVGGSNIQQRELMLTRDRYKERPAFMRPTYSLSFMDSDICGFCTASFPIRGMACTIGGASASGQMAIIQAAHAVQSGQVDVCIALGALMDLSYWECLAFRALGAMGSDRFAEQPALACRPFDRDRDGFIFGEACGAIVIETAQGSARRGVRPYAFLQGWGVAMDGNRNSDPSLQGEVCAIEAALHMAERSSATIDYINPHATGSTLGDETELKAFAECGLTGAYVNSTKSLIGHGLSAAGTVEAIATLLQMQAGRLHPTRNLDNPIDATREWVRDKPVDHQIENALTMSLGFGGTNTALCWQR